MSEKAFPDGIIAKRSENAPEFVIVGLSFKVDEFIQYLKENESEKGWVNIEVLRSKQDKIYCKLNEWKPDVAKNETTDKKDLTVENNDDLPF